MFPLSNNLGPLGRARPGAAAAHGTLSTRSLLTGGGGDWITCPNLPAFDGNKLTLGFWARRASTGAVVSCGLHTSGLAYLTDLAFYSDGNLYFLVGSAAGTFGGSIACNDTAWHHALLKFDGTLTGDANRLKGYLDGVQQSLSFVFPGVPSAIASNGAAFDIGLRNLNPVLSNGKFDDVFVAPDLVSDANISGLAGGSVNPVSLSPQALYRFETASVGLDSSGNGYDGTPSGSPTQSTDVPTQLQ